MSHHLKTLRLQLRSCTLADLPLVHMLWINAQIRQFLFDNRVISLEEARGFIADSVASFEQYRYGLWLIFAAQVDSPIGFAGAIRAESEQPSLIYGIHPVFWGHGYATESTGTVMDYLLTQLALPTVIADVDEPNLASIRVLQKLGMTQTRRAVVNDRPLLYFERSQTSH